MTSTATIISIKALDDIDPLGEYAESRIEGRNLQPGMIILNDMGCPVAFLSHYENVGTPRNPGVKVWHYIDLESGGRPMRTTTIGPAASVRVMA